MAETKITFDQFGGIAVENTGYTGKSCEDMTNTLLNGLSAKKRDERKKPEYNMVGKRQVGGSVGAKR